MRAVERYMFRDTEHNDPVPSRLTRRLGMTDAIAVGLAAMLPGIFAALGPAVAAAGAWSLLGLALAAVVAWCNGESCAQLAACHPRSGGAYAYGRIRLGPAWGFLAGTAFLVGKVAAAAAVAGAVGAHLFPNGGTAVALLVLAALALVNAAGIRQTAVVSRVGAVVVAVVLVVVGVVALVAGGDGTTTPATAAVEGHLDVRRLLESAALLFFAFGGYARIATLGEEVGAPARVVPRAIRSALAIAAAVYLLTLTAALATLGSAGVASSGAPFRALAEATGIGVLGDVVHVGVVVGAVCGLLSLLTALSRTTFAMAADGELPSVLGGVHPRRRTPNRADIAVFPAVAALVVVGGVPALVGAGALFTLLYYAVANAAALRLTDAERTRPAAQSAVGLGGCLVLASALAPSQIVVAVLVLGAALAARQLASTITKGTA